MNLTDYDRVLSVDSDIAINKDVRFWFDEEFEQTCTTISADSGSPVFGDWIMLRPNKTTYEFMVNASLRHEFSVAWGWDGTGLFQFPWPRPEDDVMPSFELFQGGFANDFATARCRR